MLQGGLPSLRHIKAHLVDEGLDAVEAEHGAQPGGELYADAGTVQVAVEVQDVRSTRRSLPSGAATR